MTSWCFLREQNSDLVILSIGVRPDSHLAKNGGLQLGKTGGIKVNEYLQTSHPDIYAEFGKFIFTDRTVNCFTGKI